MIMGRPFIELLLSDREQLTLLSADVSVFFKLRDGIGATEVKALTEALNIAIDRLVCVVDSEHPLFQAVAKAAHFIASSSSLVS